MSTTRTEIQNQIDAAYDCDQPGLAAELEATLKTLPAEVEMPKANPYADYLNADGSIDTGKLFGV